MTEHTDQTRPQWCTSLDMWVTGPVVDYATSLDEREAVGHVEFAIQLNAAGRPRGGPWSRQRN